MTMKDFELIPHTADIQIRVYGATMNDLFRNALIGMFQAIGPQAAGCTRIGDRVQCPTLPEQHDIEVTSIDRTALLIDFLSQAVALSDIHNQAYLDVVIKELTDTHIKATVQGVNVQGFEVVEIKAVTYHDAHIRQIDGIWQVDIVFDI